MSPVEQLRQIPIFSDLTEESLDLLAGTGSFVDFLPGTEIETPEGTILIICEGQASCFIRDAADKRFLLGTSGRGDVLGELSYLTPDDSNDQKVELQASGTVSCFRLPAEEFFAVVWGDRSATMFLNQLLARRLAGMNAFAKQVVDVDIDPAVLEGRTVGEKVADWISAWIGSWYFLAGAGAFTAVWIGLNMFGWLYSFDPFPFILLNLVFSIMSAATMPVLLISQNRQNQLDRMAARVNHRFTLRSNQLLGSIMRRISDLEMRLESLNKEKE